MMNNYFCRYSVFWKSRENFNVEELTKLMLVGYNFTENFTVDVAVGFFSKSLK